MIQTECLLQSLFPHGIITSSLLEDRSEAYLIFLALHNYPKFLSTVSLSAARLPSTDEMLIYELNRKVDKGIKDFIKKNKVDRLLLRSERKTRKIGYPSKQGVLPNDVSVEIKALLSQGPDTIISIQTAGNIFRNLYNINIEINPFIPDKIIFEVSGPGFTASDLNRMGLLHERLSIPSYAIEINRQIIKRDVMVEKNVYFNHRQKKVEQWGIEKLSHERSLLLEFTEYPMIPDDLLQQVWLDLPQIKKAAEWIGLLDLGCIISLSFLMRDDNTMNRYYWDIHPLNT